jgi:hypothetical protein
MPRELRDNFSSQDMPDRDATDWLRLQSDANPSPQYREINRDFADSEPSKLLLRSIEEKIKMVTPEFP